MGRRKSSIWPQLQIPTWLRHSAASFRTRTRDSRARAVTMIPAASLFRYGSPEGSCIPSPGGWRAAGVPTPLRHPTSPSLLVPLCKTQARKMKRLEGPSVGPKHVRPWQMSTCFPLGSDGEGLGVLKSSLAKKLRHTYLARWERELRSRLPVYKGITGAVEGHFLPDPGHCGKCSFPSFDSANMESYFSF